MSKPVPHKCVDCAKKMQRCRAVFRRCSGVVDWVCRRCWAALDYAEFMGPQ